MAPSPCSQAGAIASMGLRAIVSTASILGLHPEHMGVNQLRSTSEGQEEERKRIKSSAVAMSDTSDMEIRPGQMPKECMKKKGSRVKCSSHHLC